jgi:DmsE family decaheme c-type cytochrome
MSMRSLAVRLSLKILQQKLCSRRGMLFMLLLAFGLASCTHAPKRTVQNRRATEVPPSSWAQGRLRWRKAENPVLQVAYPTIAEAEFVDDDELCMTCHDTYAKSFGHNVHRNQKCEDCHGPASQHLASRGREPGSILSFKNLRPAERSEICLKCHEQDACTPGATWRTSVHAHNNVACTDCHRGHYNLPTGTPATNAPGAVKADTAASIQLASADWSQDEESAVLKPSLRGTSHHMGAIAPEVCYKCHPDTYQLQEIAHPHQIGGTHGFNCTTCHNPHGKLLEYSRKDLCLECHNGSPTGAYHSSSHDLNGVACTDCHNPHPDTSVLQTVDIHHTNIRRPKRMPMAVNDPDVCYKCHPKILGQTSMPSHHPIREGKMVCSDCHDAHGQAEGGLKEATVNMVCYKCHADKQGPFVYEHPPVTENCSICHNPHGTVENNLLKQPATFLCLRCHTGHRTGPTFGPHTGAGLVDVGNSPSLQRAFYSDCSQCHNQIHGSDLPSPHLPHALFR